jgi:hypothetical protein
MSDLRSETTMKTVLLGLATLASTLTLALPASAQTARPPDGRAADATAALAQPSDRWHLYGGLGYGGVGGDYGDFLEEPVSFELRIAKSYGNGAWRLGGGLQFGSMAMKPPYQDQAEWAHFETFGTATRVFNVSGKFRPYLQGRVGLVRIHPRSELFYFEEPENLEPGASPTKAVNGVSFSIQPGVEVGLAKGLALDVSARWSYYKTGDYSLIPPLHGPLDPPLSDKDVASSGRDWVLQAGLAWQPFAGAAPEVPRPSPSVDPATGQLRPLPPPDGSRDAWGVRRSWGWATGEMLAINFVASMGNEYVRQANFNQISPRSFWSNFEEGFTYDDNQFKTNQLIHPFNGAAYFNAARANGIDFWGSSAMALVGAFIWECCGETHPMSFNDMVSTGIGGIARGEMAYRVSSLILDNTKRGKGRFAREAGAFLVNPIRGFNRVVTGDATEVQGNPADPLDWRPDFQLLVRTGARIIGQGESISENTNTYGFVEATLSYGDAWADNRRPYDRFDTSMQVNIGDKTRVGRLLIRGDLFSKLVGKNHSLALQQDFDYVDNEAYEYGGQSLGPSLLSRFGLSRTLTLVSRAQAYAILLGAVNSDYSFLADVANQERIREYDYGPGVGAAVELYLQRKQRLLASFRYRYSYISVSNGSVYSGDRNGYNLGLDASHNISQVGLKLELPLTRSLGIGAEGSIFFRRSHYDLNSSDIPGLPPGRRTITQRNPEVRVNLTWTYSQ